MHNPVWYSFHIGKDLIINGVNIYREITKAVDDWEKKDYYDFGF